MFESASCLDDERAAAVLEGRLTPAERQRIDAHLEGCADCRRLVSSLVSLPPTSGDSADRETADAASDALERGAVIGRFVVLHPVGAGGMGVVYAAYDPQLDRKVALKLIAAEKAESSSQDPQEARGRLLREAQAMARVTHPNVVAIHDVGSVGDRVFITLEFVEGGTVRQWLAAAPRTVAQILRVFGEAGRGLAAAHRAGLTHRDFKPDNVLLDRDGRARVTDFGLAHGQRPASGLGKTLGSSFGSVSGGAPDPAATQAGTILGTPAYMSPEQHRGTRADQRSDQYAFCAALYQALFGQLPFVAEKAPSFEALRAAALSGERLRFPAGFPRVSRGVRRALQRGLELDPARRFPSMEALLHALDRAATNRTARWGALGGGLLLLTAGWLYQAHRAAVARCATDPAQLAGIWDPARRDAVQRALLGSGVPLAADTFARVDESLSAWLTRWSETRRSACEAVRVRHQEPEELLVLRDLCFDRRLDQLRAVSDLLATADATVVQHAVEAVRSVAPLADCLDTAALTSQPLLPLDPRQRQRAQELRRELDRARALRHAGKYAQGLEVVDAALGSARQLGDAPTLAEALVLAGWLREDTWDLEGAERLLYEAAATAEGAHADRTAAEAWTRLIRVVGYREAHHEQGELLARVADAALRRAGQPADLSAALQDNLQALTRARGQHAEALDHARQALALSEQAFGASDPRVAAALDSLELLFEDQGNDAQAWPLEERARAIRQSVFGDAHPEVARSLSNLAWIRLHEAHFDEADRFSRQSIAMAEAALGAQDPQIAVPLDVLGLSLLGRGRNAEALAALTRALALEQAPHPEHPYVASLLSHLARAQLRLGHSDAALATIERAEAMQLRFLQPDHPEVAETLSVFATILRARDRPADALARATRGLAIAEKAYGAESPRVLDTLDEVGQAQLASGDAKAAAATLERALRLREGRTVDAAAAAEAQLALGKALWLTGERARGRALGLEASGTLAAQGPRGTAGLADAQRWLAAHSS